MGSAGSGAGNAGNTGSGASAGSGATAGSGANPDGSVPDGPTCGLAGLPCCANGTCADPSLACDRSYVCAPCGGPGQVCCDNQPSCVAPNTCAVGAAYRCDCTSTTNTACAGCGTPGHRCCSTSPQCSSDSVCGSDGLNDVCFACGGPGQACCPGSTCAAGGCCFNGSCVADGHACRLPTSGFGICSGGVCGCGKVGQRCCPRWTTEGPGSVACSKSDTVCRGSEPSDTCVHCGDVGETCCPPIGSIPCNGTSVCDQPSSTCKPCGVTGNPCCAGNKCNDTSACCSMDGDSGSGGRCVGNGSLCNQQNTGSPGVCMSGSCRCGSRNQPCCLNPPAPLCGSSQDKCGNGICVPCGVAGNPCCANNTCENGGCCVYTKCIASGATCTAPNGMSLGGACSATGVCGSCGGLSQPCCEIPGPACVCTAPNTFSVQGTCQACGGAGQPCCPIDPTTNIPATCLTGLTCQPVSTGNNTCQP